MIKKHYQNAVIGFPLQHSLSPKLHNYIYKKFNISATLTPHSHSDLEKLIQWIHRNHIALTAVTMPFKESVLNYIDHASSEVLHVKSANTLLLKNKKLYAYNTDIQGIEYALKPISLLNKNALILGAGGAARAVAYIFKKHQANLFILNRNQEKASSFCNDFDANLVKNSELHTFPIDIIVNTTPVGMHSSEKTSVLESYKFNSNQIVFDLIYHQETALLRDAKKQGARILSGIDMFIAQGLKQIELWTNHIFPTDTLITSLITLLK